MVGIRRSTWRRSDVARRGCRTDAGASNPRGTWWGAVANAVPHGSPRRCNVFRLRLRLVPLAGVDRHVTAGIGNRVGASSNSARKSKDRRKCTPARNSSISIEKQTERGRSRDYDGTRRGDDRSREIDREILKCAVARSCRDRRAAAAAGVRLDTRESQARDWCNGEDRR